MFQKLVLNDVQKAIFKGLSQKKPYEEIAEELQLTVDNIQYHVRSVFCILGFKNARKEVIQSKILGERDN